jgi:hypothetical protein
VCILRITLLLPLGKDSEEMMPRVGANIFQTLAHVRLLAEDGTVEARDTPGVLMT